MNKGNESIDYDNIEEKSVFIFIKEEKYYLLIFYFEQELLVYNPWTIDIHQNMKKFKKKFSNFNLFKNTDNDKTPIKEIGFGIIYLIFCINFGEIREERNKDCFVKKIKKFQKFIANNIFEIMTKKNHLNFNGMENLIENIHKIINE
jgi:translation elongation factor EF-1beta